MWSDWECITIAIFNFINFELLSYFSATVAENYQTFWVGVTSPKIEISKLSQNDDSLPPPQYRPVSTTPPYYRPELAQESSAEFDPFYTDCSVRKLCFGVPQNCVALKNCKAVVAITVTGDQYEFEMKAGGNAAWVGVGLSDDQKMGSDSVIECVKTANGGVAAYMSWTTAKPYSSSRLTNVSSIVFHENWNLLCK